ncbi:hypothetical protein ACROYT_G005230 [Oculina patagonica]
MLSLCTEVTGIHCLFSRPQFSVVDALDCERGVVLVQGGLSYVQATVHILFDCQQESLIKQLLQGELKILKFKI